MATSDRPLPIHLPSASERGFSIRIGGASKLVACWEATAMDGLRWSDPASPMSTRFLVELYKTGAHTDNGGRLTSQIRAAIHTLTGHLPALVASYVDALGRLRAGYVLGVAGDYSVFGTTLAGYDLHFARTNHPARHAGCVGPIAPGDLSSDPWVWWRDPLGHGGFEGRWIRWSTIAGTRNASGQPDSGWGVIGAYQLTGFAFGPADMLAFPPHW